MRSGSHYVRRQTVRTKDVVWKVAVKGVKSSPYGAVTAHKMVGILLKEANCVEYVTLNLTELLRDLGDEQDIWGNLVQSEELGKGRFSWTDLSRVVPQNGEKGQLLSSGLSLCLSA